MVKKSVTQIKYIFYIHKGLKKKEEIVLELEEFSE